MRLGALVLMVSLAVPVRGAAEPRLIAELKAPAAQSAPTTGSDSEPVRAPAPTQPAWKPDDEAALRKSHAWFLEKAYADAYLAQLERDQGNVLAIEQAFDVSRRAFEVRVLRARKANAATAEFDADLKRIKQVQESCTCRLAALAAVSKQYAELVDLLIVRKTLAPASEDAQRRIATIQAGIVMAGISCPAVPSQSPPWPSDYSMKGRVGLLVMQSEELIARHTAWQTLDLKRWARSATRRAP